MKRRGQSPGQVWSVQGRHLFCEHVGSLGCACSPSPPSPLLSGAPSPHPQVLGSLRDGGRQGLGPGAGLEAHLACLARRAAAPAQPPGVLPAPGKTLPPHSAPCKGLPHSPPTSLPPQLKLAGALWPGQTSQTPMCPSILCPGCPPRPAGPPPTLNTLDSPRGPPEGCGLHPALTSVSWSASGCSHEKDASGRRGC